MRGDNSTAAAATATLNGSSHNESTRQHPPSSNMLPVYLVSCERRNRDKVMPLLGANEENAIVEKSQREKQLPCCCCCRENAWRTFCNQSMCC